MHLAFLFLAAIAPLQLVGATPVMLPAVSALNQALGCEAVRPVSSCALGARCAFLAVTEVPGDYDAALTVFDAARNAHILIDPTFELPQQQLLLLHELGHVLGHDHVSNPMSIMYFQPKVSRLRLLPAAKQLAALLGGKGYCQR